MDKEERAKFQKEKRQVAKVQEDYKKRLVKEPLVKFQFSNNEDPPTRDKESPLVKFNKDGIFYEVQHGKVYEFPESVVKHLNSLRYPIYQDKKDPQTGAIKSVQSSWYYRFSCMPVNLMPDRDDEDPAPKQINTEEGI